MLIDGRFRDGSAMRAVINLADGKPFVDVPLAEAAMTQAALAAVHIKVLRHGFERPDW